MGQVGFNSYAAPSSTGVCYARITAILIFTYVDYIFFFEGIRYLQ